MSQEISACNIFPVLRVIASYDRIIEILVDLLVLYASRSSFCLLCMLSQFTWWSIKNCCVWITDLERCSVLDMRLYQIIMSFTIAIYQPEGHVISHWWAVMCSIWPRVIVISSCIIVNRRCAWCHIAGIWMFSVTRLNTLSSVIIVWWVGNSTNRWYNRVLCPCKGWVLLLLFWCWIQSGIERTG